MNVKWHELLRRRVGCIVILVLLVPLSILVRQNAREASVRDSFTLMKYAMSGGAKLLQEHRKRFGQLPPRETTGSVYLPLTRELVHPVDFDALTTLTTSGRYARGTILYSGPPIDPYRAKQVFAGESKAMAIALGHDGEVGYRGYPLRYSRVGTWAVLISNGPDRDVDITLDEIRQQSTDGQALWDFARTRGYDPTNGTLSSGDCIRVVEPSQDWQQSAQQLKRARGLSEMRFSGTPQPFTVVPHDLPAQERAHATQDIQEFAGLDCDPGSRIVQ